MTLLALLREHGDVIEADVQRHYGVDTTDLWRGTLSLRRLRVLVDRLPPDSATAYALAGHEQQLAGWRLTDMLLGRLADELAVLRWQWEAAHADPKKHQRRKQPDSVLPQLTPDTGPELRLVSPHSLGAFVHDTEEVTGHGD